MALVNNSLPVSVSTTLQINVGNNTLGSAVMYTVPVGRKFVGNFQNINNGGSININGVNIYCYCGNGTSVAGGGAAITYTLLAGTVVKENTANTSSIFGIESAA